MARFIFNCETDGSFKKSYPKRVKESPCPICGEGAKLVLSVGSLQVVEVLDNGAMARKVERMAGIEEIMNDRADAHSEQSRKHLDLED